MNGVIHIVRGDPSDAEVAALTVVMARLAGADAVAAAGTEPDASRSAWADPVRRLRTPLQRGPGAWRASALPR